MSKPDYDYGALLRTIIITAKGALASIEEQKAEHEKHKVASKFYWDTLSTMKEFPTGLEGKAKLNINQAFNTLLEPQE